MNSGAPPSYSELLQGPLNTVPTPPLNGELQGERQVSPAVSPANWARKIAGPLMVFMRLPFALGALIQRQFT